MIRFRHRDTVAASDEGGDAAVAEAAAEHRSPGLQAALALPSVRFGCRVLDLGPALPSNISFMGTFAAHVCIADLAAEVGAGLDPEPEQGQSGWTEVLRDLGGPFDLVLAWDLFSRLDADRTRQLVEHLRRTTRRGSVVFLLIHEGPEMPSEPPAFEIRDRDRVAYRCAGTDPARAPKIPPAEVARRLPGFRVEASYVLRHGVREYVAVREGCDDGHIS